MKALSSPLLSRMSGTVSSCADLIAAINELGILPLLRSNLLGWSAEDLCHPDCDYRSDPEEGWEWPLWEWKGDAIRESGCAYGHFVRGKATFISSVLWPHFCNVRRHTVAPPAEGSIEEAIHETLALCGSTTTRDLRKACGFTGTKQRGKFGAYVQRLEMGARIVTEDFVYPHDRHGRRYGWGWSLLTTPEALFGREACHPDCSSAESREVLADALKRLFPDDVEAVGRFVW